jgi:hypothetical protein
MCFDAMWPILGDAPPNSWMDSIVSPNVKIVKGQGIGAPSLVRRTLG